MKTKKTKDGVKIEVGMKVWILPFFAEYPDRITMKCLGEWIVREIHEGGVSINRKCDTRMLGVEFHRVFAQKKNMISARKKVITGWIKEELKKSAKIKEEFNIKIEKLFKKSDKIGKML